VQERQVQNRREFSKPLPARASFTTTRAANFLFPSPLTVSHAAHSLAHCSFTQALFPSYQPSLTSLTRYYHKTINDVSGALNWGKAVAIVDASAATVFAYQFGLESYENSRINREVEGANALWSVVTIPNSREKLTGSVVKLGLGVSDRVFSVRFVWRREEGGGFVLAFEPTEGEGGGASGTGGRRSMMLNDIAAKREALKRQREVDGTTQDARVFAKDMEEVQGMIDGLGDAAAEEDGEVQVSNQHKSVGAFVRMWTRLERLKGVTSS